MVLIGVHRINKGALDSQGKSICRRILDRHALLVGSGSWYGTGVYAYYPEAVPSEWRDSPFIVFQLLPNRMKINVSHVVVPGTAYTPDSRFFLLPAPSNTYVDIAILGFVNCPFSPTYPGRLTFV